MVLLCHVIVHKPYAINFDTLQRHTAACDLCSVFCSPVTEPVLPALDGVLLSSFDHYAVVKYLSPSLISVAWALFQPQQTLRHLSFSSHLCLGRPYCRDAAKSAA